MKKVFLILIFSVISLFGDPDPFGFELGKATFEEVSKKYPDFTQIGNDPVTKGKQIVVNQKNFDLKGLNRDVIFGFDTEDKLIGVLLCFDEDRFDDLLSSLSKYKMVEKYDNLANFKDGNSIISLDKTDFDIRLLYRTKKYDKLYEDRRTERERKNKQNSMP
ncbi:hypothetical protein [Campylobacter sp. US33a]|uniref:Uncharacterized protein n=1 Tax=Campylobacter sp. CCS1377 TaxID=3158229 RepID=A0AAU7E8R2_9BACT|nr:hypothetical protein [Campylobacter sp. US33a]TEY04616.1 hypothetical protein ELQ16_00915 [Campylobacter sp. US33a]